METTRKTDKNGAVSQTNYMLDDVIESFEIHSIDNDNLIKELAIQKINYARECMAQMLSLGGESMETINAYHKKFDNELCEKITEIKNH